MLTNKTALVTGASRGIGAAIAKSLAKEGAFVIINYNGSKERADAVAAEITADGGKAAVYGCNVSDYSACEKMAKDIMETYGHLDILVNNAGITRDDLLMKMSGICVFTASFALSVICAVISVSMNPGATALQVIPREESSLATLLVSPITPALLAL